MRETSETIKVLFLLMLVSCSTCSDLAPCFDPDCYRGPAELIESRGFKLERYWPVTDDGYILGVFRIVNPYRSANRPAYPILMTSSFTSGVQHWLWNVGGDARPPDDPRSLFGNNTVLNQNLGFELANFGYDVWLFNRRGTQYSVNHTTLTTLDFKFWEFSYNEVAFSDIPTMVKLIQQKTGSRRMGYVGHSDGCKEMFLLLARRPRYNDIFRPVILGFDLGQLNKSRVMVYASTLPAGVNTWCFAHQLMTARARQTVFFDYGLERNREKYGRDTPPPLELYKITNKYLVFIYGDNDQQSLVPDVRWTIDQLSVKLFVDYLVPWHGWNHLDYLIANDLGSLVTPLVIKTIARALRN